MMYRTILLLLLGIARLGHAQPSGPSGAWDLVFEDNFEGTALDLKKWSHHYPWGRTHNHRAYMADTMVRVQDGVLSLKAIRQRHPQAPDGTNQWQSSFGYIPFDYTSGAIHSNGKFNFTYGYLEGRLQVPATLGTWPAFWTLNANGAWPPEIDVLEVPGDRKVHHYYYHYGPDYQNEKSFGATHTDVDKSQGFHTYGVEWGPDFMRFYFDGKLLNAYNGWTECSQGKNMYIILNLAVGGWAPAPSASAVFPAYFLCDWIRVWKRNTAYKNLDFESGTLAPWGAWNRATVTSDCKRSGSYGVKNTGSPSSIEQTVEVAPNTTYIFGGYARVQTPGEHVMFGVKHHGGPQLTSSVYATGFTRDSVVFTTGPSTTSATLFWYKDSGAGAACGDDFFFRQAEVLTAVDDAAAREEEVQVYPHPFAYTTKVLAKGPFTYRLFDAIGHLVGNGSATDAVELGQSLKPGTYTMKITAGSELKVVRITKSN